MEMNVIRQFVKVSDGRIGVVIANEVSGGVFRGHCDMWFGEIGENGPIIEQLFVGDDWETVEAPIGIFPDKEDDYQPPIYASKTEGSA